MRQRWGTNQRKRASYRATQVTTVGTNTASCLDLALAVHNQRGFAARAIAVLLLSTMWSLNPKNQLDNDGIPSHHALSFGGTRSAPPQSLMRTWISSFSQICIRARARTRVTAHATHGATRDPVDLHYAGRSSHHNQRLQA